MMLLGEEVNSFREVVSHCHSHLLTLGCLCRTRYVNIFSSGQHRIRMRRLFGDRNSKSYALDMNRTLAFIYLEKHRAQMLQNAGVPVHSDTIAAITRSEASRRMDPALWRIAMAYATSKRFIDETHVLASSQCGWCRHLHIDYVEACCSRKKCLEVITLMEERGAHVFNYLDYVDVLKQATNFNLCILFVKHQHTIPQMSGFDSDLNIGGVVHESSYGFGLRMFSKPMIVIAHVAFNGAALAYYFLANWLSSSFVIQFLVILTLLSMDFWTVKNITGRLLVGLRWWNFVDDNGNNHWKFESAKDRSRFRKTDRRAFWVGLIAGPIVWLLFVITAFFTFKWEWMVVALMGLCMNCANLYGYLRCRWADTNQFSDYISKWAFISMLRQQNRNSSSPMHQTV
ncbi:hypothetical protein DICVIV_05933 [Dictyocaulus viviparus]|uniref:Golgi apparatus membrane protein TVP23 homolog n=1 Tax=Dictyocaulus viviparus TaxID=29172 RepID=A0A0D8XVW3_DICVI|nr:hypothetical protein DICVIV_05933 [Dictyocaulus viviparus]